MIKQYRLTALLLILLLFGCEKSAEIETIISIDTPDWTEATHGKSADPDYTTVFPQDQVQRLDITISNDDWDAIQSDLARMPRTRPGETMV